MLTAGDEFGRTQAGNNNAYAQDNATSWLDWAARDQALEAFVAGLAAWRRANPAIGDPGIRHDLSWLRLDGEPMTAADWDAADGFAMMLPDGSGVRVDRRLRTAELLSPRQP